jgi:antitoxin VapB
MAIYITNPEAEELAREIAAETGETITDTVIAALRDRRDKLRKPSVAERKRRLMEISERTAALIGDQKIDYDDLYDKYGLPK